MKPCVNMYFQQHNGVVMHGIQVSGLSPHAVVVDRGVDVSSHPLCAPVQQPPQVFLQRNMRLLMHISTTIYSQVLLYTAE